MFNPKAISHLMNISKIKGYANGSCCIIDIFDKLFVISIVYSITAKFEKKLKSINNK